MRLFVTKTLPIKKINFISGLFDKNGELKSWQKIFSDFQLTQNSYFICFELIHETPKPWKLNVLNDKGNLKNIIYLNYHLIKNNQLLAIEKLIPKELYSLSTVLKNKQIRPKNIFATFSPIYKLNGRRFISCDVKFQMTPIYQCSNIKY